ncbi:MAG: hypothetical protein ACJ789_14495 [Thermomicrobiales bacterium]
MLRRTAGITVAGALVRAGVRPAAAQGTCAEGLTACAGVCVDLSSDLNNCGACDAVCESSLVGVACYAGECVRTSCPAALTGCPNDNPNPSYEFHCFDLSSDPNNCGECGTFCPSGACTAGTCAPDVGEGTDDGGPTLPDTGSGSAARRPGGDWAAAAFAAAAVFGAAAVRKAHPRRARDDG